MHRNVRQGKPTSRVVIAVFILLALTPGVRAQTDIDTLPFKNNIQKNVEYARNLYDFGDRDQSLALFREIITAFGKANKNTEKA